MTVVRYIRSSSDKAVSPYHYLKEWFHLDIVLLIIVTVGPFVLL